MTDRSLNSPEAFEELTVDCHENVNVDDRGGRFGLLPRKGQLANKISPGSPQGPPRCTYGSTATQQHH